MTRRPRTILPGVALHLVHRGINRMPTFFAREDYLCFLRALRWASVQSKCAIHAYVLMPNHVHLLLTPAVPQAPARMSQSLGALYVGYINRRYSRTGSLWERRYRSTPVDSDRYLLACSRYIELNPVRAGLAKRASEHPWSSFHRNVLGAPDPLITPHRVYSSLGPTDPSRRLAYQALLEQVPDPVELEVIRSSTKGALQGQAGV